MSLDKSLKSHGDLVRHRNVLTRAERLATLKEDGRWEEGKDVFGLPKVAHRKVTTKKVKAAAAAGTATATEMTAAAPAAGSAATKAAPAKTAAPKGAPAAKAGAPKGKA